MSSKSKKQAASIVWFDIPADDLDRAKAFYGKLFGWKITEFPGMPGGRKYFHVDTGGPDAAPDGGMLSRNYPGEPITNYIIVPSVTKAAAKVTKLGGKICRPKTAVPQMGYFVFCEDTEGNMFALWERNEKAK